MSHTLHMNTVWEDIPDIVTVVGLKGIAALRTQDCVKNVEENTESWLLTVNIHNKEYKLRVLKEFPDLGIVIPDKLEYPQEVLDLLDKERIKHENSTSTTEK